MTSRRWGLATSVLLLAVGLAGVRSLDAPLFLYPASASLPEGLYMRSFGPIEIGKIAAFAIPEAARRYQAKRARQVPDGFLFMKPIAAGPGDQVCNGESGLVINGAWLAATATRDREGARLPVWRDCRRLHDNEYFAFSGHVGNSFDSRYFGPIEANDILGVYRSISLWAMT